MSDQILPGSFRDPSGFVFFLDGSIYRQVNNTYKENYDLLIKSGLYEALLENELLIAHCEVDIEYAITDEACKVIKPDVVPFISYPYEWCFSQLKDAALATLAIQKKSLEYGMSLKDCSAFNIQFIKCKPVFIDTLSFEKYIEGRPWAAYGQFCQHFLAPLALMSYKDVRLSQLLRIYLDGIPLDLASSLLGFRTRFMFSLLNHIHLHAKSRKYFSGKTIDMSGRKISRLSFLGLIDSLESAVRKLKWRPRGTEWADYYKGTNYSVESLEHKSRIVSEFLDKLDPKIVWDLGANVGLFSRIAGKRGALTISIDSDPAAVEKNYLDCVKNGETDILPLAVDLNNPSANIGWENRERTSLLDRGPADTAIALALIHHLAISNNLPLHKIARFFNGICDSLIIEFVPKSDSQAQCLLSTREDIFPDYTKQAFENEFSKYFTIHSSVEVKDSERTMYLMRRKNNE